MTEADKLLAQMRNNPRGDWSIDNLKALAERFAIDWRQPGTSHVTFCYDGLEPVTVPARKPIKPIYIVRFLGLIDKIGLAKSKEADSPKTKATKGSVAGRGAAKNDD
jgi:hypothetical protein